MVLSALQTLLLPRDASFMPTRRLHARRLTWPFDARYTHEKVNLLSQNTQTLPAIEEDEDPSCHFLTPVPDADQTCVDIGYNAGILPRDFDALPLSSANDLFRARLEERWESYVARSLLKRQGRTQARPRMRTTMVPSSRSRLPSTPPDENDVPDLSHDCLSPEPTSSPEPLSPHATQWSFAPSTVQNDSHSLNKRDLDGWEADKRAATTDTHQSGGTLSSSKSLRRPSTRTSSGKRHAWQKPSLDLWTVEEEEEEEQGRDRSPRGRRGRKRRKMVHWEEHVQVLLYER